MTVGLTVLISNDLVLLQGLLANISDNAHSASQNLKTKSQNMNIKSLTGKLSISIFLRTNTRSCDL